MSVDLVRGAGRGREATTGDAGGGEGKGDREWDLTAETKERLGFPSTGTVWAAPKG